MREFFQTILKSTEDRIKNPFIGTFITSWIIFNWKPILFIIFSDKGIESKINFIKDNYNDIWCYLWLPLVSAVFYIAILPYISFIFEYITKFSHELRNKVNLEARNAALKLQIGVAQNEIKLEEEKTTYRERNSHNQLIENLQKQVQSLTQTIEDSNKINSDNITALIQQKENIQNDLNDVMVERGEIFTKLTAETTRVQSLSRTIENLERNVMELTTFNSNLKRDIDIEKFLNDRTKHPVTKVIGTQYQEILEYFNVRNDVFYFAIRDRKLLTAEVVMDSLQGVEYSESVSDSLVARYVELMWKNITQQEKEVIVR